LTRQMIERPYEDLMKSRKRRNRRADIETVGPADIKCAARILKDRKELGVVRKGLSTTRLSGIWLPTLDTLRAFCGS
jgi:hypothetical protein